MPMTLNNSNNNSNGSSTSLFSVPTLFLLFILLSILSFSFFFFFSFSSSTSHLSSFSLQSSSSSSSSINVYVADLPRSLNYDLLHRYWSINSDSRLPTDPDSEIRSTNISKTLDFPPYPENPLIKQYSAEYWIMGDLMTPPQLRTGSFSKRVFDALDADVVFVPFFATLSAELQLGIAKGVFRKKVGNDDHLRQREVMDFVKNTQSWKRSGGRDHVFVLTGGNYVVILKLKHSLADPVAMWHVKDEIAPAVLLVVDFGGWYRQDSKSSNCSSSEMMIQHTQVSVLKDVIVPYTHLLPRLRLSENQERHSLLYFKGAKHRHRGGLVREKLWDMLINEPGVIMEEGFPNATGREQSIRGMRASEFCLHPAGDTPTSCRLFDAIQSLCIPVIVSDGIELPFEGMVDYSEFSVFVAVGDALKPSLLVNHLKSFSKAQIDKFRQNMARVQPIFVYDNGHPGGIGPIPLDGAVNHIWKKVHQKLPMIKEAIIREKRKPAGVLVPLRCHCT
ncbi:putative xylogalacturonan beta-1,3-xylosyltransferase [Lupinus albus]|uniref:Putative xylogalacturonan beta-1,3-xylosyltransferase n=1 Tax=Lupinus albus TaxID=3870 RepID=A0A6A4NI75_LUPAL|nr:putative xylogalacturonan beta-1,3-xylosyltransferase [Lupinus albus]